MSAFDAKRYMLMVLVAALVMTGCASATGTVAHDEGLPVVPLTPAASEVGSAPAAHPTSAADPALADAWLLESIPTDAHGDSTESAIAMAQFYLTLFPGVFQGADRSLFESLMTPDCVYCASMLAQADQNNARGLVFAGGQFAADPANVQVGTGGLMPDADAVYVTFAAERGSHHVQHGSDAAPTTHPATKWSVTMWLVHREGLWRVREISMRPGSLALGTLIPE